MIVLPQFDDSTLVEAIRTIYSPNLVPTSSFDVEIAGDSPEAEEVAFTLVINKKCKRKYYKLKSLKWDK